MKKDNVQKKVYKVTPIKVVKDSATGTCCFVNTYKTQ